MSLAPHRLQGIGHAARGADVNLRPGGLITDFTAIKGYGDRFDTSSTSGSVVPSRTFLSVTSSHGRLSTTYV